MELNSPICIEASVGMIIGRRGEGSALKILSENSSEELDKIINI